MASMSAAAAVQQWAGRRLLASAEATARRKARAASSFLVQLWNLLLVLGGFAGVTYGVYQLAEWAGWIAGGLSLLAVRSLVTFEKAEAHRADRT